MLVVHKKDLPAVPSHHDPIENVVLHRLLTDKTLPKVENGDLPYINWAQIPPGKAFSPHRHGDGIVGMTEFFIIINGEGEFAGGSVTEKVTDGDLISVPKGEVHSLKNNSTSKSLVYICFGIANGGKTVLV
jgi:uncharacterized cupin superfamily protein